MFLRLLLIPGDAVQSFFRHRSAKYLLLALLWILPVFIAAQASPRPSPAVSPAASPVVSPSPATAPSSATPVSTGTAAKKSDSESVFAPFVNRLRIAVKDPQIRLTWEDVPGFTGTYLIYRNNTEISLDNLAKSVKVAEVKQGDQYYTDVPPAAGVYFYAVLAREASGTMYSLFIPLRNKTITPTAIANTATQNDLATGISAITASPTENAVVVTFQSSRNNRNIALLRSASPFANFADLQAASQVATTMGRSISITDYAVPGVPYYYAAVDVVAFQAGVWAVSPGVNALAKPVEISLGPKPVEIPGLNASRRTRTMPLPVLTLPNLTPSTIVVADTNPTTISVKLDPETRKKVEALAAPVKNAGPTLKQAQLLPSDRLVVEGRLSQPAAGEIKPLYDLLIKYFTKSNWDESIRLLDNFLSIPHAVEIETKARFYLGQSLYLIGKYKEALLEFLLVQDELEDYAQVWIDNTLALSSKW